MSRLDKHVSSVQNKLALHRFVEALAWTSLALGALVLLAVLADRFLAFHVPNRWLMLCVGGGIAVAAAGGWALFRRPTRQEAAVAIDDKLQLKEKFATALYVRPSQDPFALAAVRDAEQTADAVRLHQQFPMRFPGAAGVTLLLVATALACGYFITPMNLLASDAAVQKKPADDQAKAAARSAVERSMLAIENLPKPVAESEEFKILHKELAEFLKPQGLNDAGKASRSAMQAMQQTESALAQQKEVSRVADVNNEKMLNTLAPADDRSPVGKVTNEMRKGDFTKAVEDLKKVTEDFDKKSDEEKKEIAQQMEKLADQMKKAADDPQTQQQVQQQLQQAGMSQPDAQKMAQQMQQAAGGDKNAQQQLQQQAQQAMSQMNNGQGPTAQQKQQFNQMMQQAQAAANSQQQAQQMAQGAQQMAQAMKQSAQQGGQGNQANQQQGGTAQGNQAGGQQGAGQQMANAQQQMKQAMQQMQAARQDAQQIDAQQKSARAAMQQARDAAQGAGGDGQQNGQQPGQQAGKGTGQWGEGKADGQQQPGGEGGPGLGQGGNTGKQTAMFSTKEEVAPTQDDPNGKILASTLIKMAADKGESKAGLANVRAAVIQEKADDVEAEHVSGQARKATESYFNAIQDAGKGK